MNLLSLFYTWETSQAAPISSFSETLAVQAHLAFSPICCGSVGTSHSPAPAPQPLQTHRNHCPPVYNHSIWVWLLFVTLEGVCKEDLVQLCILTILWQAGYLPFGQAAQCLKEPHGWALFLWDAHGQLPSPSRKHPCPHACSRWTKQLAPGGSAIERSGQGFHWFCVWFPPRVSGSSLTVALMGSFLISIRWLPLGFTTSTPHFKICHF